MKSSLEFGCGGDDSVICLSLLFFEAVTVSVNTSYRIIIVLLIICINLEPDINKRRKKCITHYHLSDFEFEQQYFPFAVVHIGSVFTHNADILSRLYLTKSKCGR